eukprot:jgi/Orpsp1_1/1188200/evm.model.d7180000063152.1
MEYRLFLQILILSLLYIVVDGQKAIKSTKTVPKLQKRSRLLEMPKYLTLCSSKELKTYNDLPYECFKQGGDEYYLYLAPDYVNVDFRCYNQYEALCIKYTDSSDIVDIISSNNMEIYINGESSVPMASLESKLKDMKLYKRKDYLSDGTNNLITLAEMTKNYIKDIIIKHLKQCISINEGNEFYYYTDESYGNLNDICLDRSGDYIHIRYIYLEDPRCYQFSRGKESELSRCMNAIKTWEKIDIKGMEIDMDYLENTSPAVLRKMITIYPDTLNKTSTKDETNSSSKGEACWSLEYGYQCCQSEDTQPYEPLNASDPEDNRWYGIENNEWCGLLVKKATDACWSEEFGYPCCQSDDVEPLEPLNESNPEDKRWYGVENGEWCGLTL